MASGVLRRVALLCHYHGGVYNSGWRKCVTIIGEMVEPAPFSSIGCPSTDAYDQVVDDQIGHIDDIEWTRYNDKNLLSGTVGGPVGSPEGPTQGGELLPIQT